MRLECGCGYVADGTSEDEFVVAAQTHARAAHGISLTGQQILGVVRENQAPLTPRRASSLSRPRQPRASTAGGRARSV